MADVDFLGTLAPPSGGTLPITRGEYIIGATIVVADATARDAIPATMLRTKQLCLLASTGLWYQWSGASWGAYTGFSSGGGGGGMGFRYTYSATTTDADPGAGIFRGSSATLTSGTLIFYIDLTEYGGTDVTAWLDAIDDTIGAAKGVLRLQSLSDPTKWLEYWVTTWTTASGYRKITGIFKNGPGGILTTAGDTFVSFDAVGLYGDLNNQALTKARTISYNGEVDNGNSSTADTIDWTAGSIQKSTLTGNCTYTFTAPTALTPVQLRIIQDGTGGRTVTWPGTVIWDVGYAPNMADGPGVETIISGYYDGTNYKLINPDRGFRIVTEAATTRNAAATDANALIKCTNASGCVVTVHPFATVPWQKGTVILLKQAGAAQAEFDEGAGVTIDTSQTLKTEALHSVIGIIYEGSDVWTCFGERELA